MQTPEGIVEINGAPAALVTKRWDQASTERKNWLKLGGVGEEAL